MLSRLQEVYQYRSMLWSLVLSELRTKYKGSALGFLWTFVNPLLILLVYSIVFSTVMRVALPHYASFVFTGLLAWNMFATSVQSSTGVIIRQASLVKKIYFPREILPLSVVGGSLINYLFSLVILLPFLLINHFYPTWLWAFLPILILSETLLAAGFSMLFAAVNVFLRDLEHILGIVLMAWFYITPVVYSLPMIPNKYVAFFKLNPVTACLVSYQDVLYYHHPLRWKLFLYGVCFSLLIFYIGWRVFDRLSKRFAEEV